MRDYMKALHRRFETPSQRVTYLEKKVNKVHRKLAAKLDRTERKMLLRLTDMEDALRDEACLNSFFSSSRLAQGIQQELAEIPPYNFEDEDEQWACRLAESERKEK